MFRKIYLKIYYFIQKVIYPNSCNTYFLESRTNGKNFINKKVDIIIPIYNGYDYLVKCIDSVLKASDIPFDLYLLNDRSTDNKITEYLQTLQKDYYLNKFKNTEIRELIIVNNEENLGFVKNINSGIEMTINNDNHFIILNTDTQLPNKWLSRIIEPLYSNPKIASVTPVSNSATILSIPNKKTDNPILKKYTVNQIDQLCNEISYPMIYLPTGIGYCMAMNKSALKEVGNFDETTFLKGYGEENDWCFRAIKKGYINVGITNLFVFHEHGVSFGEKLNKEREKLRKDNYKKLIKKHPAYEKALQRFLVCDPLKEFRKQFVKLLSSYDEDGING